MNTTKEQPTRQNDNELVPIPGVPGGYTLPDCLVQRPVRLSSRYTSFAARMRARENPITYLKFKLGLLTPEEV